MRNYLNINKIQTLFCTGPFLGRVVAATKMDCDGVRFDNEEQNTL